MKPLRVIIRVDIVKKGNPFFDLAFEGEIPRVKVVFVYSLLLY